MKTDKEAKKSLPPHLRKIVDSYENKCKSFEINPNWAAEAYEKAEKNNDDFALIHAMTK